MLQFSANWLDARKRNGLPRGVPSFGLWLSGFVCFGVVFGSLQALAAFEQADGGLSPREGCQSPKPGSCAINAINAIIAIMASITIRRLPENTKRRLRIRAARNGRSMEQEARELLEAGLARKEPEPENLGEAIRRRFAPLGGVDLKIPPRRSMVRDPGIR
jgi:plasmid stability protein